jgi:hypothetical protein
MTEKTTVRHERAAKPVTLPPFKTPLPAASWQAAPAMTPAEELAHLGERIFGRNWQIKLAREWTIDPTTVNRWARGGLDVPGYALPALRAMDKAKEYEDARAELEKAAASLSRTISRL